MNDTPGIEVTAHTAPSPAESSPPADDGGELIVSLSCRLVASKTEIQLVVPERFLQWIIGKQEELRLGPVTQEGPPVIMNLRVVR